VSTAANGSHATSAQSQADAEVKANNEEVLEEYHRRQEAEAPSPEEEEAKQAAADFYAILGKDEADPNQTRVDSGSFCELMSAEAREQTIHYAEASSGIAKEWDCESAVELLVVRSKRAGAFKDLQEAKVIGVNADGEKATATVRFGNGPATAIALVREDGEWKLAANSVPGR
jgi:hypothetical protein